MRPLFYSGSFRAASIALASALLFSVVPPASAHHSGAPHYDLEKKITIKGTVTKFEFVNPHAYVFFDVTGADGKKTPWRCEMAARVSLARNGWTQETFTPGMVITITGSPARREDNVCVMSSYIRADGKEFSTRDVLTPEGTRAPQFITDAGNRPARLPNGQPNITGNWLSSSGPGAFGPLPGRGPGAPGAAPGATPGTPPSGPPPGAPGALLAGRGRGPGGPQLTPEGEAELKKYDQRFDDPSIKCNISNIFFGWTHDQHVNMITQSDKEVVLTYGYMDYVRTIRLNSQHPKTIKPTVGGDSIGKWEGDTLVVDTIGTTGGTLVPLAGTPFSDQMHAEERFTFDPKALTLTRTYKAQDPKYWKTEYTGTDVMKLSAEPHVLYGCKELSGKNNLRPAN